MMTHIHVRQRRSRDWMRPVGGLRWGVGMRSGGIGGQAGKACSVAALIYVHADIKGPCTWLFPNHYRRTINYGRSLITIFCKWKRDNKCMPGGIGVRLRRLRWVVGGTKQRINRPNRSQYLEKRPVRHSPFPSLLCWGMGGTAKNRKFHITQKRANVNNQMSDTWPELQCWRCQGFALFWLHKHLVTGHRFFFSLTLPSSITNLHLSHPPHMDVLPAGHRRGYRAIHYRLLFLRCFLSVSYCFNINQTDDERESSNRASMGGHTRRGVQRQTLNSETHTRTHWVFDIQICLCVTQTFPLTHHTLHSMRM